MVTPRSRMTINEIKQKQDLFLEQNNLSTAFYRSRCDWNELIRIGEHFESQRCRYTDLVQGYLSEIASFEHIHSYRHRIKETESLLKKIIDKTDEKGEPITLDNYRVKITDLIGIRVLYVFKSDYYPIHEQIWKRFEHQTVENIHIKLREGDDKSIYDKILKHDPVIEPNSVYRSIHYTVYVDEKNLHDARLEIQTRTIFEEGWSEVNHNLIYKNENYYDLSFILGNASKILSALVGECDSLSELMKGIHDKYAQKLSDNENSDNKITDPDMILQDVVRDFLQK